MQPLPTSSPTTSEAGTNNTASTPSKPELAHSSMFLGDGSLMLPSGFLSTACNATSLKAGSLHGTKLRGLKHYQEAYEVHDHKRHRRVFHLAQATRRSLDLEKELALQRVREGKILLDLLQSDARLAQLKVDEADLQIGMMRAVFEPHNLEHESDNDEFLADDDSSPSESDSGSDIATEQKYFDLAGSSDKPHVLTEEAVHQLVDSLKE